MHQGSEVPSNVVGNNRVAYSFLTRQETDFRLQGRGSVTGDFEIPNLNLLADNLQVEQSMGEHWFGVTYSCRATAHVGFGATTYLAVRNQEIQILNFATALGNNNRRRHSESSVQVSGLGGALEVWCRNAVRKDGTWASP